MDQNVIYFSDKVISNKQTFTYDREFGTNDITIAFDFLLAQNNIHNHEILSWSITDEGDVMRLYVSVQDGNKVGFYWRIGPYYDGQLLNRIITGLHHIKRDVINFSKAKCTWNEFQLRINFDHLEMSINRKKKRIIVNEQTPIPVLELIQSKSSHVFIVKGNEHIALNNFRVMINPIDESSVSSRKRFCQIKLVPERQVHGGDASSDSEIGQVFLTPEISYVIANTDNNDETKKNYLSTYYTNTSMSQLCLANPFTSLRAFFVDILFKNLILFGLLYAFLSYFSVPAMTDLNQKLIICAVVCILYNLLNFIFNSLQNIAVWACQYSHDIGGLVSNQP